MFSIIEISFEPIEGFEGGDHDDFKLDCWPWFHLFGTADDFDAGSVESPLCPTLDSKISFESTAGEDVAAVPASKRFLASATVEAADAVDPASKRFLAVPTEEGVVEVLPVKRLLESTREGCAIAVVPPNTSAREDTLGGA